MRFRKLKQQSKNKHKIKQQEIHKIHYARTIDRIKAFITDMFMIYVPILYIITYVFLDGKDDFQSSQYAPLIGVSIYGFVYAFLLAKLSQTPGKKAYTMKVVDATTYEKIGFFRALLRFIAFLFSATVVFGLLTQFYRKDNKMLHDILASTVVIEDR